MKLYNEAQVEKAKAKMLREIAHELRTGEKAYKSGVVAWVPLNSLRGAAGVLEHYARTFEKGRDT